MDDDLGAEDALWCCKGMIEELIERVQLQRSAIDKAPYPISMSGEHITHFLNRALKSAHWGLEQYEPEAETPNITVIAERR